MAGNPEEGVTAAAAPEASEAPAPAPKESPDGEGGFDWITLFLVLVVLGNIGLFFYNRSRVAAGSRSGDFAHSGPPPGAQPGPGAAPGGPGGGPGTGGPGPGPGGPGSGGPGPGPGPGPGGPGPGPGGPGPGPAGGPGPGPGVGLPGGAPGGATPGKRPTSILAPASGGGTAPAAGPPAGGTGGPPPAAGGPGTAAGPGADDPAAEARSARWMLQGLGVDVSALEALEKKAQDARTRADSAGERQANVEARDQGRKLLLQHYAGLFQKKGAAASTGQAAALRAEGEALIAKGDLRGGAAKLDQALNMLP